MTPDKYVCQILCPRCHEQCGWCSDYRHMHGLLKLPGTRKRCGIVMTVEDSGCPVCKGSLKVIATTTYEAVPC